MRVFRETGHLLVRVQWSDALGLVETRSWPNTRDGVIAAKAWARAFSDAREQPAYTAPSRITLRELWERYVTAEFPSLRRATRENYAAHWRTWELFAGRSLEAELVTPELLDTLRQVLSGRTDARGALRPVAVSQQRQVVGTVKRVFAWGVQRELVQRQRLLAYRFKVAKEQRPEPVAEYTNTEHAAILAQFRPRLHSQWRAWALTVIAGEMGPRINAALHLSWADVDLPYEVLPAATPEAPPYYGAITWRAEFDKLGNVRVQPLTRASREALFVALGFARANPRRTGLSSDWVFFTPASAERKHKGDGTYSVQAAWRALCEAERRAGVTHLWRRAFHGGRRMAAGNALEATDNPVTAMQWIGDTDLKQARKYLKEREDPMRGVAQAISKRQGAGVAAESPDSKHGEWRNATATAPEAPARAGSADAVTDDTTTGYDQ